MSFAPSQIPARGGRYHDALSHSVRGRLRPGMPFMGVSSLARRGCQPLRELLNSIPPLAPTPSQPSGPALRTKEGSRRTNRRGSPPISSPAEGAVGRARI
jgi:hypothetical protein